MPPGQQERPRPQPRHTTRNRPNPHPHHPTKDPHLCGTVPNLAALGQDEGATMALGVHSEVGNLRKVMIHRPGLEHSRLTPSNADELLFDDVLWVKKAKEEHDAFAEVMRERGVDVYYAEGLLAEALVRPEVKD